jgi:hypothetical protein
MALIGNYGFETTAEDEFLFNFEIPDNCNFTPHYDATKKINTVTVQLNSGQSQPSSTFVTETYSFTGDNGLLDLRFAQVLNGVTTTKPKIKIEF